MKTITENFIGGRKCFICEVGDGDFSFAPVVYMGVSEREVQSVADIADGLANRTDRPFILCAFASSDWNGDFSPWAAPPVFGNEPFAGKGRQTLDWLRQCCILQTEAVYAKADKHRSRIIAGYSLAGLFSLWAYYETCEEKLFRAAVSCSGSYWYPGWREYFDGKLEKHIKDKEELCREADESTDRQGYIYLSLGDREARTKNRQTSQVEAAARYMDSRLSNDPCVGGHIFELNSGGHFKDNEIRMTKGIAWALGQKGL